MSLNETTGKLVPRKVNALLDHGIKPIYEMATEDGRAINTTGEHPYLAKLYDKELCDKYAGNVWNKEANQFDEYCTRWVEVDYLTAGDYIAVPLTENNYSYFILISGLDSNDFNNSSRSSLEPAYEALATVPFSTFLTTTEATFIPASLTPSFTVITNLGIGDSDKYNYLKLPNQDNSDVKFEKIISIKTLEPQHVYDLSIEGTRNFIANDIVAHNTYLATSSGNVGINTTTPNYVLQTQGGVNLSNSIYVQNNGNVGIGMTSPSYLLQVANATNAVNLSGILYINGSSGNVFIGATTPFDGVYEKLEVNGSIHLNGPNRYLNIASDSHAYVFIDRKLSGHSLALTFRTGSAERFGLGMAAGDDANFHIGDDLSLTNKFLTIARASGNVGIGTTSPNYTLQVASGTDGRSVNLSNVLYVNGSSGNVGMGTSAPAAPLELLRSGSEPYFQITRYQTGEGGGNLYLQHAGGSLASPAAVTTGNRLGTIFGLGYDGSSFITSADIAFVLTANAVAGGVPTGIKFSTGNASATERARIIDTGQFGINTTSPANTLTVQGTLNVSNPGRTGDLFVASSGNVGIGTTSPATTLQIAGGMTLANATGSITSCSIGEIRANVTAERICLCTSTNNWKCATVS
ncbi:hypothetical protein HYY70_00470 [Candidatus Woesearchaeota archaeon]|nr:hypothetical protein [Candidatus Woesearchaeota archaeon]